MLGFWAKKFLGEEGAKGRQRRRQKGLSNSVRVLEDATQESTVEVEMLRTGKR